MTLRNTEETEICPPATEIVPPSSNQKVIKQEKKPADKEYLGLWIKGTGGNEPLAYFHPDASDIMHEFAKANFGTEYITASVKLDSRPLITRSNLRGAKNFILQLLTGGKTSEVSE